MFIVALAVSCGRSPESSVPASTPAARPPSAPAASAGSEAGDEAGSVAVELTATVDGTKYPLKTLGQCTYTKTAAIYDVPATMWHAMVHADGQPLSYANLTIWELADHSMQTSLGLQVHGEFRHASTVKGATLVGSGAAGASRSGEGATLTFTGKDNRGAAVQIEVHCPKTTTPIEERGR